METPLTGILPVLPTPFAADGTVDVDAMARVTRFALASGSHGLVFPGFASEVAELTREERKALLAIVVRETDNRVPVVAGASAPDVASANAHAAAAAEFGIRHLMIQPPVRLGNQADPVTDFMAAIAGQWPDMRFILQNAPAPRGADLAPDTICKIAEAVPQIAYVKEETLPAGPAISRILADRPPSLLGVIGGGGARYILDEYERGACAAMPAVEIADLHVDMDAAWRAGRRADARGLYVRTLPLLTLQAVYRMRLTKHVLMRRGILRNAEVRAATPPLDGPAIADIETNLVELDLVSREAAAEIGAA